MRARWLAGLLVGCAWVASCGGRGDDGDPLSAAVIDDLSQEQGDAEGSAWSGTYATTYDLIACDCPEIEAEMGGMKIDFDICEAVDFTPVDGTGSSQLLQTEGFLLMTITDAGQMTGPLHADGRFTVASHVNLDSLLFDNQFLGRIDGELEPANDTGARFEGLYRQRIVADYLGQDIDCRASFDVVGERGGGQFP